MASKNVSFDSIPSGILKPGQYIEYNLKLAKRSLPAVARSILLIGQMTEDGTATPELPVRIYSDLEAGVYFGQGSVAHRMAIAALTANKYAELTVIAPEDGQGAVAATGKVVLAGTATSPGLITLAVGDETLELAVASGDTAAEAAAALVALLADSPDLPLGAAVNGAEVDFTAKVKGTLGNTIPLSAESTVPGITATLTPLANGLVDPSIEASLTAVRGKRYHFIVSCVNSDTALGKLSDHLNLMSGPIEKKPGFGIAARIGAIADELDFSADLNKPRLHLPYLRGALNLSWEVAAAEAAVWASEPDPARPLNGLPLAGIAAPAIADRLSREEQEDCLKGGLTPLEVNVSEEVCIVRAISNYNKNGDGIKDLVILDVTKLTTMDYVREATVARIALRFPRQKLSAGKKKSVRTELLDVLEQCEALELIENVAANKDALIVEPDEQNAGQLNATIPTDVIEGLHVFAGRMDLL